MKTFKQHLNALEKQRKLEKNNMPNDGVMPVYVHGSHAKTPTVDNSFPNYVHGKHASTKVNEEEDVFDLSDLLSDDWPTSTSNKPTAPEKPRRKDINGESNDLNNWARKYNENVNEGKGINSLDAELREHYDKDLTKHPDKSHLYSYTKSSASLNKGLIYSHKNNTEIDNYHQDRVKGIDNVVGSVPAPRDFDTFSGLGFDPRRHMDENNVLFSPAYLSSSINPAVAASFSQTLHKDTGNELGYDDDPTGAEKHMLRIPVRQFQTNGAYVNGDGVSHFGVNAGNEQEFLHKRGQKYKIDPTPQVFTNKWSNAKTYMWTATPHEED